MLIRKVAIRSRHGREYENDKRTGGVAAALPEKKGKK